MTTSYYRDRHAIIVVFDLTNPKTYNDVPDWIQTAKEHSDAYIVIVGNKSDDIRRAITTKAGALLASQYGMPYFETSAKDADVEKIFYHLAETLPRNLSQIGTPISPTGKQSHSIGKQRSSQSEIVTVTHSTKSTSKKCCN